jgi:hypothetical protein
VATKLKLSVKPAGQAGQFYLEVVLTTAAGNPVEDGEILVSVSGGNLQPGSQGQALLSAAAGRHLLTWTAPKTGVGRFILEARYFGGQGPEWEYGPASASLSLPPEP